MPRHVVRLAAATFLVAAGGVVATPPAQAATCGPGSGVSVVVDFHQLRGGGPQARCDATGAGKYADAQFAAVDFLLTYVQNEPGFVCQVDGAPDHTCPRTPPANAYWSLWWSDGKSGEWTYSSTGVTALKVPEGGSVALSWQGQSSQAKPRVAPTRTTSQPSTSPTKHPSPPGHPSTDPGQVPSSTPGSTTSSATSSAAPPKAGRHGTSTKRADPSKAGRAPGKASHGPDETQAAGPSDEVAASADGSASDSGGLPGWVAPLAIGVLFVGAGTIAWVRRRGSGTP